MSRRNPVFTTTIKGVCASLLPFNKRQLVTQLPITTLLNCVSWSSVKPTDEKIAMAESRCIDYLTENGSDGGLPSIKVGLSVIADFKQDISGLDSVGYDPANAQVLTGLDYLYAFMNIVGANDDRVDEDDEDFFEGDITILAPETIMRLSVQKQLNALSVVVIYSFDELINENGTKSE
jgi:hypothetical protein